MKIQIYKYLIYLALTSGIATNTTYAQNQERPIGANLTDLSPFGTLWMYTNALKQSSGWLIENASDENDPINFSSEITAHLLDQYFDANGYPLEIPFTTSGIEETAGKSLQTICLVLNGQPSPWFYPSGNYLLVFQGTGTILVQGDVDGESIEFTNEGQHIVSVSNPSALGLILKISESSVSDPIHNVQLIFPDYINSYQTEKFRQDFIDLIQPFHALRFMKPARTENNTIENWTDRTALTQFSYFLDVENDILLGMPYEDIFELSSLAEFDPWIPLPYRVNNDYVQNFALLVNNNLSNERSVYIEYSNEAWNPSYPETRTYMLEQGNALNLATSTNVEVAESEAVHRFYAKRMFEVFGILEANLTNPNQLIKVHGAQSDPFVADLVLEAFSLASVNPNDQLPDAIAPASYIGVYMFNDLADQGLNVCDHTALELLDTLTARIDREMAEALTRYSEVTQELGIDLFAYEGGQHVTEINFQPMDPCAEALVAEMNNLPEMENFICELFDNWYNVYDGKLFMFFNLAEGSDAFGSFGLLESQWQSRNDSPKWQGMENCVFEKSITSLGTNTQISQTIIYPNPIVNNEFFINNTKNENVELLLFSLSGSLLLQKTIVAQDEHHVKILERLNSGVYIAEIHTPNTIQKTKILIK